MIAVYRNVALSPFSLYTDPTKNLYRALGLTFRTLDAEPADKTRDYVIHGLLGGVGVVLKNAIRVPLPTSETPNSSTECLTWHRTGVSLCIQGVYDSELAGVDMNPNLREIRHLANPVEEERWMLGRERKMSENRNSRLRGEGFIR
jgi:hypothetical protein